LLRCVATVFFALGLTGAAPSSAIGFVRQQQQHVERVLRQRASDSRDAQLDQALKGFFDYDEIVSRAFGDHCPAGAPACEDLWSEYSDSQRAELRGLVERFVRQIYRRNLDRALDYAVTYRGARNVGGNTLVMTEATNHVRTHDPGIHVDYLVEQTPVGPRVIDMVVAGSSLTSNYYAQFREQTHRTGGGYARIVQKLRDKIAEGD
jgi:ABC-type transporter MlaC component